MGERSRAARLVVAGVGLALVAGCGADRAASPAWLPPSSYATLTTTDPLPARSPGTHAWVDPRIAEPPRADSRTAAAFVWSGSGAPTTTFGRVRVGELERLVRTDLTDVDLGRADMAVTTTLATPAEARGVAARVRSRLRQGSTRYGAPRDAVVVLGSSVVVRGIRTAAALRSVRDLLPRHAGGVLAEGDRYGEGAVVTDLSCRPTDPARARAVARDLADYAGTPHYFFLRPPWARPSLTRTERLARSTYTRFNRVLEDAVADDPESQQLWFDYRRALQSGDSRWMRRLQRRLAERRLELSPSRLDGPYDKRTLASLRAQPLALDAVTRWAARVGRRMGQLPLRNVSGEPVPARQSEFTAAPAMLDVRLAGRIDVSMFLPEGHFAPSLAALVLHLDRAGCTDVRYRLLDWDTVRAD